MSTIPHLPRCPQWCSRSSAHEGIQDVTGAWRRVHTSGLVELLGMAVEVWQLDVVNADGARTLSRPEVQLVHLTDRQVAVTA